MEIDFPDSVNQVIVDFLKIDANTPFTLFKRITDSEVFKKSFKEEDTSMFPNDNVWTLREIYEFSGIEPSDETDLRIPLEKTRYNAITKYLRLLDKSIRNVNNEVGFTFDEILELRQTPLNIINSVKINGARIVK